ncbi:ArsR/SmtB family transcription factor [Streptomyces zingiberis]|uniref:Helix-turn-helix transcriptional regulator n=1 Tax=Streptomyces zingiberis TaxID=2053010 RepID=A0ABX1BV33_9ACTN|nr:winged helix-turn-helix domain-containing protein [Streptomyces zingiberis]NJQ01560.1 helix-turn-helix transcriptional regulator [Streptomyces zingiberis]
MTDTSEGRPTPAGDPTPAVLDAQGLRAMAHPVRVQLIGLLRRHGPSTATRLAERLGVNSGTASYHLRRLGAAGFVEEDPERGNARERWWRPVHQSTWFNEPELAAEAPEAALTYLQSVAAEYAQRSQRVINELATMPRAWRETFDLSNWPLRITSEEAAALGEEVRAVLNRYRRDAPGAAATAPEGAERVSVILHLLPELDEAAPAEEAPGHPRPAGPEPS